MRVVQTRQVYFFRDEVGQRGLVLFFESFVIRSWIGSMAEYLDSYVATKLELHILAVVERELFEAGCQYHLSV